jgi:hypothetical protein
MEQLVAVDMQELILLALIPRQRHSLALASQWLLLEICTLIRVLTILTVALSLVMHQQLSEYTPLISKGKLVLRDHKVRLVRKVHRVRQEALVLMVYLLRVSSTNTISQLAVHLKLVVLEKLNQILILKIIIIESVEKYHFPMEILIIQLQHLLKKLHPLEQLLKITMNKSLSRPTAPTCTPRAA